MFFDEVFKFEVVKFLVSDLQCFYEEVDGLVFGMFEEFGIFDVVQVEQCVYELFLWVGEFVCNV